MDTLFFILFFLSVIGLIVGVIKPRAIIKKDDEQIARFGYRKANALGFGILALLFFILFAIMLGTSFTLQQPKSPTNQSPITIQGQAPKSNTVKISLNDEILKEIIIAETEEFSLSNIELMEGDNTIKAELFDEKANPTGKTRVVKVIYDITSPEPPKVATTLTTDKSSVVITGTAEKNAVIKVYQDKRVIETAETGDNGNFSIEISDLAEGENSFSLKTIDEAGNQSKASEIIIIYEKPVSQAEEQPTLEEQLREEGIKLALVAEVTENNSIKVIATTNLPDGVELMFSADDDPKIFGIAQDRVSVRDGIATTELYPQGAKAGIYEVEVKFFPSWQEAQVTDIIGENGEFIKEIGVSEGILKTDTLGSTIRNSTSIVVTGVLTEAENQEIGIGITRKSIIDVFEKPEFGFSFSLGRPVDGKENYVATKGGNVVQLLGRAENLSEASIIAVLGSDADENLLSLVKVLAFAEVIDTNAVNWVSSEFNQVADNLTKSYSSKRTFDGKLFEVLFTPSPAFNAFSLTVKPAQ